MILFLSRIKQTFILFTIHAMISVMIQNVLKQRSHDKLQLKRFSHAIKLKCHALLWLSCERHSNTFCVKQKSLHGSYWYTACAWDKRLVKFRLIRASFHKRFQMIKEIAISCCATHLFNKRAFFKSFLNRLNTTLFAERKFFNWKLFQGNAPTLQTLAICYAFILFHFI